MQIAAFCEKVIKEADSERLSLIGVIEGIKMEVVGPELPDEMPPCPLGEMTLALCLWSGDLEGQHTIHVQHVGPAGNRDEPIAFPVVFQPGLAGVNLIVKLNLVVVNAGVHWFDVLFVTGENEEDRLLSRVPLDIQYRPQRVG